MSTKSSRGFAHPGWVAFLLMLIALTSAVCAQAEVLINEVDADTEGTDMLEFLELFGVPNEALDGKVLVFYNGNGDVSYAAYDLDGFTLDANGYFLLGNTDVVPTPSIIFGSNGLQNGADAVALYTGDGADFPNGTPVTALNILDAIVYDTDDGDDAVLLSTLTPGQPQINERDGGDGARDSSQRVPDGAGGALVTTGYIARIPTPGATNGTADPLSPVVDNVYHRHLMPEAGEVVTVSADVTDENGTIVSVELYVQVNGGGFSAGAMTLDSGDTYTGTIAAGVDGDVVDYYVVATDNDALTGSSPEDAPLSFYSYTVASALNISIASVQADPALYEGLTIMIHGQVYIPGDYEADGSSVSAYIQGSSDRGLNVSGVFSSTGMDLLNDTSNLVQVTGTVELDFSTVKLVNYEVELISTGNPALDPDIQTSGAAADPLNEGTYTGTTGPITVITTTSGLNPAHNFTVNDGSGDVVIRIDDDIVVGMDGWALGDELVAAGAGSAYFGQGQILVGLASDITNNGQGPDLTPPTLVSALLSADTEVTLVFSESIDPVTGNTAGNYEVFETGNEANTITVLSATVQAQDDAVVLTLAAGANGTAHTVRINNVEDLAGNPIAADTTADIFENVIAEIVINEIMQNPTATSDAGGEWFEVYNAGDTAVDMNLWTIKDQDFDSHVIYNGGPLVIGPGEYKIFAVNADTMLAEGVTTFYEYNGIALANGGDELILLDTYLNQVDIVVWDDGVTFPDPAGASMQWTGVGDNADGTTWAVGGPPFGSGDIGTPGFLNDVITGVDDTPTLATALGRNYPNPFNPRTNFNFTLKEDDRVSLRIYDLRGREVRTIVDADLPAGDYTNAYSWDGRDAQGRAVTSGTYFYCLTTGSGISQSLKMTLLK